MYTSTAKLKTILCNSKSKLLPNSNLSVYKLSCKCGGNTLQKKINMEHHANVMKQMLLRVCFNYVLYIMSLCGTTKKPTSGLLLQRNDWVLCDVTQSLRVYYVPSIVYFAMSLFSLKTSSAEVDELSRKKQIYYERDRYVLLIHVQRLHTIRYVFKKRMERLILHKLWLTDRQVSIFKAFENILSTNIQNYQKLNCLKQYNQEDFQKDFFAHYKEMGYHK